MIEYIELQRSFFKETKNMFFKNDNFKASLFTYKSGVEAIEVINSRGKMVILPYLGQIIWDLSFDDVDLKMKNMFLEPKNVNEIVDTYGCFAFHSGMIRNGCPSSEDDHSLHGEMPCSDMDKAWLEITEKSIKVCGSTEYVKGFGHHYIAKPSVEMLKNASYINIEMAIQNLAGTEMPLQYMCHMNYAYIENAKLKQNIPDSAFELRASIPDHVKPTEKWLEYNEELKTGKQKITMLNNSEMYDPEIVFFADHLSGYQKEAEFEMISPDGTAFFTNFSTKEFDYATRWILYNEDQQVGAFVLPGTCRSEGFLAAKEAGSLIILQAGEEKTFKVTTGKK